jgi:hypothetical protein
VIRNTAATSTVGAATGIAEAAARTQADPDHHAGPDRGADAGDDTGPDRDAGSGEDADPGNEGSLMDAP